MRGKPALRLRRSLSLSFLAVAALVLARAGVGGVSPAVLVVDDDGQASPTNCDATVPAFTSIQAAINSAFPGDVIKICPGIYVENLVVGTSNLVITSFPGQKANTIVNPVLPFTSPIIKVTASNVRIVQLTLDGEGMGGGPTFCDTSSHAGIVFTGSSASGTVQGVTVRGTTRTNNNGPAANGCFSTTSDYFQGVGIAVEKGATAVIEDSDISDYQTEGIHVIGVGSSATIRGNTIVGPGVQNVRSADGVRVEGGATATITENTIRNNKFNGPSGHAAAVDLPSTSGAVTVTKNTFKDNCIGVGIRTTASVTLRLNSFEGNGPVADCPPNPFPRGGVTVQAVGIQNILCNSFQGNGKGLDNKTGSTVTAEWNWWGAANGPAPSGSGDLVEGFVDFDPWLTSQPDPFFCPPRLEGGGNCLSLDLQNRTYRFRTSTNVLFTGSLRLMRRGSVIQFSNLRMPGETWILGGTVNLIPGRGQAVLRTFFPRQTFFINDPNLSDNTCVP